MGRWRAAPYRRNFSTNFVLIYSWKAHRSSEFRTTWFATREIKKKKKGDGGGGNEEKWKKEKMKRVIPAIDGNQIGDGMKAGNMIYSFHL